MGKYAKRIDAKLQGCKEKWFVDAWNTLKELVQKMDDKKANESIALYMESLESQSNYDYIEESLYEEGFMDKLKAGWKAFKNAGNDGDSAKGDKKNDAAKKQGAKKTGAKQPANQTQGNQAQKKPSLLQQIIQQNGWNKKQALKPENIKIIAAKLKKKKDAIPAMIEKYFKNPPKQDAKPAKGDAKAGNKGGDAKGGDAKGKILQFLKKHWKMITIVLIAAIAFMLIGPGAGAKFLIGPTIRQACKLIGGAKGAILGTVAGIAGTAAALAMGGDGDVDAGDADVDADVDVDAGDTDVDTDVDDGGSGVKGDLDGDGDHDADDLVVQRGNQDWLENLSDKDKTAISKTFNDDPDMIAANGYAGMTHGGDNMLIHANSSGGFTANVEGIAYANIDSSGNLVDMDGNPLDLDQELQRIADSDPHHGVLKAKLFANGYYGLQRALKSGALQAIKNMH